MENKTKKVKIEIPVGKVAKWVNGVLTLVDEKPQDVTERIKTFADACRELGYDHPFVNAYDNYMSFVYKQNKDDYDVVAYLKLRIITAALNEGWEPQFIKDERRWFFWCKLITKESYDKLSAEDYRREAYHDSNGANAYGGVALAATNFDSSITSSCFVSHFAFKSEKLAAYAGRQFIDIYAAFCFKPKYQG